MRLCSASLWNRREALVGVASEIREVLEAILHTALRSLRPH